MYAPRLHTLILLMLTLSESVEPQRPNKLNVFPTNDASERPIVLQSPADLTREELVYLLQNKLDAQSAVIKLSPCARAILACCQDNVMRPRCFEQLGCGPLFFNQNPCDRNFILTALRNAEKFYNQFEKSRTK